MPGISKTNTDLLCLPFILPSWYRNLGQSTHLLSEPYSHLFTYLSIYLHLKLQFSKASCVKLWDTIHQRGTDVCSLCSTAQWSAPRNQEKRCVQVLMSPTDSPTAPSRILADSWIGVNSTQPHYWECTGASVTLSSLRLACLWHSTGLNHMKLLGFECQKQPK